MLIRVLITSSLLSGSAFSIEKVRIMYAYTKNAASAFGGSKKISSRINTQFAQTERAFERNTHKGKLVNLIRGAKFKTKYNSTVSADEQVVRLSKDKRLADVRRRRNRDKADLCQLYCRISAGYAGYAEQIGAYSSVRFSNLRVNSGDNAYTSAHEIGHNFGAHHHIAYCLGSRERTLMTIPEGCKGKRRILYFSHPIAKKSKHRLGSRYANNTSRVLRNKRKLSRFK